MSRNFDAHARDSRARKRIVAVLNAGCEHRRGKKIDGNAVRCADCNVIRGYLSAA